MDDNIISMIAKYSPSLSTFNSLLSLNKNINKNLQKYIGHIKNKFTIYIKKKVPGAEKYYYIIFQALTNRKRFGWWRKYDTEGNIIEEKWYMNGKYNGFHRKWDYRKFLEYEIYYENGRRQGLEILYSRWNKPETPLKIANYVDDKKHGLEIIRVIKFLSTGGCDDVYIVNEYNNGNIIS